MVCVQHFDASKSVSIEAAADADADKPLTFEYVTLSFPLFSSLSLFLSIVSLWPPSCSRPAMDAC